MRIISGKARGTKLETLDGENTRPTLDRVKESLFNIIQNRIYDSNILDLFSGSGALAIESLSRGAKKAYLCDNSSDAIKVIKNNIKKTHFEENTVVFSLNYLSCLKKIKDIKFDIIFLDPPYSTEFDIEAIKYITENKMLNDNGIIVLETDREKEKEIELKKLDINIYDLRKYGRVSLFFLN